MHLTADHGGLPAGSEIQIGFAEARRAQTVAAPSRRTTTTTAPTRTTGTATPAEAGEAGDEPVGVTEPTARAARPGKTLTRRVPSSSRRVNPKLTAGPLRLPGLRARRRTSTRSAPRAGRRQAYHHGDDIFGQLGQPLVAVADGTVFSVGWNKIGGNRLWILDEQGNEFYYAHLSAFSTLGGRTART